MAMIPIPLKRPGALGIDLRSELGDVDALACRVLSDFNLWPDGKSARVLPRRPFRRFGARSDTCTVAGSGVGSFNGSYRHAYWWTDGAGAGQFGAALTSVSNVAQFDVSGWPTGSGTVKLYRTAVGGTGVLKLVATFAASTSPYNDTTVDGSLGADINWDEILHPIQAVTFSQSIIMHWLAMIRASDETTRKLVGLTSSKLITASIDSANNQEIIGEYSASVGSDRPVSTATLGDLIWLANGGSALRYIRLNSIASGSASATAPATPSISSFSTATAGTVTLATGWQYVIVARNPYTGMRSQPSAVSSTGVIASKKVTFTVGGSAPTLIDIYRTSDGGHFFQFLETVDAGDSYEDEAPDSDLSTETVDYNVGAPESGFRFIVEWKGVLWGLFLEASSGVDAQPSGVYQSNPGKPYNWPPPLLAPEYVHQIAEDDGDEITGAFAWGEAFIIFKRRRVFIFSGDPPTGFRWAGVTGSQGYGCVARRTICETPAGLIWLSPAGVCLMREPGAPPIVISDAIRDLLIDPARQTQAAPSATVRSETPRISLDYATPGTGAGTLQVRIQLDSDVAFGSVDFDYDSSDAADRGYFRVNGAAWPAAGAVTATGRMLRVQCRPPASGGPTPGTTYYVRYATNTGSGYGGYASLGTFTWPAADTVGDILSGDLILWAHAVNYAQRGEYWLWLPTGGNAWAAQAYVLSYDAIAAGGGALWQGPMNIPATCACVLDAVTIGSAEPQDYLCIADPDGLLWLYPWLGGGFDGDTRATVSDADRFVSATVSGTTITASGTSWPTAGYRLAGTAISVRDSRGELYTARVTASTAAALTVVWLGGRQPANGTVTLCIGGMACVLETGWLPLHGDPRMIAVLREMTLHAAQAAARVTIDVAGADGPTQTGTLPRVAQEIQIGEDAEQPTAVIDLAAPLHRIRISSQRPPGESADWEIRQIDLDIEQTGSST